MSFFLTIIFTRVLIAQGYLLTLIKTTWINHFNQLLIVNELTFETLKLIIFVHGEGRGLGVMSAVQSRQTERRIKKNKEGCTEKEILGKHDILQLLTPLTGERLQNNKMRVHVRGQMPSRCSAKRGNDMKRANVQTHPIISLGDLSLSIYLSVLGDS